MYWHRPFGIGTAVALLFAGSGLPAAAGAGPVQTVLHNFANTPDGSLPNASVLVRKGIVYGVTPYGAKAGGITGSGLVFSLTPPAAGQKQWKETFLHSFGVAAGGVTPVGQLVADSQGALYGVTMAGGAGSCECGTVYKLSPPASGGGAWSRQIIHSFHGGSDGSAPQDGLTLGPGGVLYGTTYSGGGSAGTVFRLAPPAAGKGQWTLTTLFQFTGAGTAGSVDAKPRGRLLIRNGNIYGTTTGGSVFSLTPPAKGKAAWAETILFAFKGGRDGGDPEGGLVVDKAGALYGTTMLGGIDDCPPTGSREKGCGVVFKLTPPAKGKLWKETILHSFRGGGDGANPMGELLIDARGALYGTTSNGGGKSCTFGDYTFGCGTIFRLMPPGAGQTAWAETILYRFPENGAPNNTQQPNGIEPLAGLVADSRGYLYGTAYAGGSGIDGVVFELSGSGFAVQ